ncbi:MAG: hypothetical protein P4L99_26330 [Chthoniobacter sp.]|nr:hypothetical protein [Chthoniobacter sp.]
MKIGHIIAVLVAFETAAQLQAADWVTGVALRSPNRAGHLVIQYRDRGVASEWQITLSKDARILQRRFLPATLDVRYMRASWSPSSQTVLLGENYKDGMDLTLLRIAGRRVISTHLDLADRISLKEEKELPFRSDLQSYAPVKRVTWSTVRWVSPTRCQMLYILHGLGYEGEGDVTVDFTGHDPVLTISRLRALSHPEYFNLD